MDQKDVKKRDVWEFKEFSKAYDEAKKLIPLKKDELAHPGGHVIKAESLYYRNDANPYIAAGIEIEDPKEANINSTKMPGASASQANEDNGPTEKELKSVEKEANSVIHTASDAAFTITESDTEALKAEATKLYFDTVKLEDARKNFTKLVEELPIEDHRHDGFYCGECKKFAKHAQMKLGDSAVIFKYDNELNSHLGGPSAIWIVNRHYDGCRGWE